VSVQTFTIEQAEIKQGSRGPFLRVKASGVGWVSVFDSSDKKFAEEHVGQAVSAAIEENDKGFKNASNFGEPTAGASPNGQQMSKAEWDDKEDRQRLGILYSVHLKEMFEWYRLGLENEDPTKTIFHSYNDLVIHARKAAVADLDWIRNYATGDVPI